MTISTTIPGTLAAHARVQLSIQPATGGARLGSRLLTSADVLDLFSELLLRAAWAGGFPEVALGDVAPEWHPLAPGAGSARCTHIEIGLRLPDGRVARRRAGLEAFWLAAEMLARKAVTQGLLHDGDPVAYTLDLVEAPSPAGEPPLAVAGPARFMRAPLSVWLAGAHPAADPSPEDFPVFVTDAAWRDAERQSRAGASRKPAVETGAYLIGALGLCPATGCVYAVVSEAFPMIANEEPYTLNPTVEGWRQLHALLRLRETAQTHAHLLLGQAHGHNFPANDGHACADCASRERCTVHNVAPSLDDELWMRNFLVGQPTKLCLIFGANVRGEPLSGLFGLRDGRLRARGFYRLPDLTEAQQHALGSTSP